MSLVEALSDETKKAAIIKDCLTLVDEEVAAKGGISGFAVKAGYSAVKGATEPDLVDLREVEFPPIPVAGIDGGGDLPVRSRMQAIGEQARRERDQRDEHQQDQVEHHQRAVRAGDAVELRVVVHPDDADRQEADDVGRVVGPLLGERGREAAGGADLEVQHEQRYRDGEDAVAEGLEPGPVHRGLGSSGRGLLIDLGQNLVHAVLTVQDLELLLGRRPGSMRIRW